MKTVSALALALAMAASPLCAQEGHGHEAPAASTASPIAEAAQPAVAVVERFSAALRSGNLERVEEMLADDVLILESGGAERSRQEYLSHHAISDAAFLKGAHVQVVRRTARREGALAWIGTESEIHATRNGKPLTLLSSETMILEQSAGQWRIVHIHWSSRPKK